MPTSLEDDLLFKEAFTHEDNRKTLYYLLACFTEYDMDYLLEEKPEVLYESVFSKTKINDKSLRGDILIKLPEAMINLECYSRFDKASLEKSLMYVTRIYSTRIDRKENYKKSLKVIGLNFIDKVSKNCLINEKIISDLLPMYDRSIALKDKFRLEFFRIDLARKSPYNKDNKRDLWLKFIGAKDYEERKIIAKGDEIMTNMNENMEMYINDENTKRLFGEWGEIIARDKGREEEKENIVNNMLRNDFSVKEISRATNLSAKEIYDIQKNL